MNYLYAAYAATWIIHIGYLGSLALRYGRLRDQIREIRNRSAQ
jgi:CcmD family protein